MIILKENRIIITYDFDDINIISVRTPREPGMYNMCFVSQMNESPHLFCFKMMYHVEDNGEWYEYAVYTLKSSSEPDSDV